MAVAPVAIFPIIAILFALFIGGGVAVVAAILTLGRRRQDAFDAAQHAQELREEMRALRESMEAQFADITLALDDLQRSELPPSSESR